jgi:hypothetical protein
LSFLDRTRLSRVSVVRDAIKERSGRARTDHHQGEVGAQLVDDFVPLPGSARSTRDGWSSWHEAKQHAHLVGQTALVSSAYTRATHDSLCDTNPVSHDGHCVCSCTQASVQRRRIGDEGDRVTRLKGNKVSTLKCGMRDLASRLQTGDRLGDVQRGSSQRKQTKGETGHGVT